SAPLALALVLPALPARGPAARELVVALARQPIAPEPGELTEVATHALGGEVAGEPVTLGQIADLPPRLGPANVDAPQRGRAAARAHDRQQDLDQRRLAGPVGPEQAEAAALRHLEVDAAQRRDPALVGLAEVDGLDRVGQTNLVGRDESTAPERAQLGGAADW